MERHPPKPISSRKLPKKLSRQMSGPHSMLPPNCRRSNVYACERSGRRTSILLKLQNSIVLGKRCDSAGSVHSPYRGCNVGAHVSILLPKLEFPMKSARSLIKTLRFTFQGNEQSMSQWGSSRSVGKIAQAPQNPSYVKPIAKVSGNTAKNFPRSSNFTSATICAVCRI